MNQKEVAEILAKGIRAPSGDNMQPWTVSVNDNLLSLSLNKRYTEDLFDPQGKMSLISLGAVIENIKISASHLGYRTAVRYGEDGATMRLQKGKAKKDVLFDFIEKRTMNRNFFSEINDKKVLGKIASVRENGAKIYFLDEKQASQFAGIMRRTDKLWTSNTSYFKEMLAKLRFTSKKAQETKDGISIQDLGLTVFEKLFLWMCRFSLFRSILVLQGWGPLPFAYSLRTYLAIKSAGRVCVITVPAEDDAWLIKGGQDMERAFIACAKEGVSIQPHGILPYLNLRRRLLPQTMKKKEQKIIQELYEEYAQLLNLSGKEFPVMAFRLGYSRKKPRRTLRRELKTFLSGA